MERYLNDLKMKWRTSLDLLAEEIDVPYGVFIRFLAESWEIFATNSGGGAALHPGIRHKGRPFAQDLFALSEREPFYRPVDPSFLDGKISRIIKDWGITHCCGFSVQYGSDPFGILFLAGKGPFIWDRKRETFLLRFKTILEEDLTALADKARYCDELTKTRLNGGAAFPVGLASPEDSVRSDTAGGVHPSATPILPLMDDIHRSHESYMPRDVKLITRIRCPSDFCLYTDGALIKQILSRLLIDAEMRTQTGEIKIECRLDNRHDRFLFAVHHPGEDVPGNDTAETLASSRQLCERLGGHMTADIHKGKGMVVILSLPLVHPVEATA